MNEGYIIAAPTPPEDLTGLDEAFHEAAREHGRALVELILSSGLANEAALRLGQVVTQARTGAGLQALSIFASEYNKVSRAYADSQGWTNEALDAASSDVEQALRQRVQLVQTPSIILPH